DKGDLIYIGNVGTGFNHKLLTELRARLYKLEQANCPFKKRPKTDTPAHWVRPELICEISFGLWTDDGHIRFPVFLGMREDKDAKAVRRELPAARGEDMEMARGGDMEKKDLPV